MKKLLILIILTVIFLQSFAQVTSIKNGELWKDTDGNKINAHSPSIMKHNGVYYMIGVDRTSPWVFNGVNLYSSTDLMNWEFRNTIIDRNTNSHLANRERITERPCLLYNSKTKQFVVWLKYQNGTYDNNKAAIFYCNTIDGKYTYLKEFFPGGYDSNDDDIFIDTDGTPYYISTCKELKSLNLYKLSDDYFDVVSTTILFAGQNREAPVIIKKDNMYYLLSSAKSGWDPNPLKYATSSSLTKGWSEQKTITDRMSYDSQPAGHFTVTGTDGTSHFYIGDRHKDPDLPESKILFYPITFGNGVLDVEYVYEFKIDMKKGTWASFDDNKYVPQNAWKLISSTGGITGNYTANKAFDNNPNTFWQTSGNGPHPHEIVIDLGALHTVSGFKYIQRNDDNIHGIVKEYDLYLSNNPINWGSPVISNGWMSYTTEKNFPATTCRYMRFVGRSQHSRWDNINYTSAAELKLITEQQNCTIIPYVNINKQGWMRSEDITVNPGDEVEFGPQTEQFGQAGTWTWTGPDGFKKTGRPLLLGSVQTQHAGTYVVTNTNQGCTSTHTYSVKLNDKADCNGNVNGTAYLDACGVCVGGSTGKVTLDTDSDSIANCVDPDDDNDGAADANDCAPLNASIKGVTTWYADADGDEFGDTSVKQTACNKPLGYVSAAGDLCPVDKNKQAPGECGCGVSDADINNNGIADCKDVSSCQAVATNTSWVARNDWADQNSGSNVSTVSDGSFKITHRQWGREFLWIITSTQTVDLKKGATYEIAFDYKDQSGFTLAGMEVGFANGYSWNGPTLVQPAKAVPSGFSTSGFTGKTVSIVSNYTGKVNLAFRLKWSGQPSAAVTNYIRNIRVCEKSAAPVSLMSESPSINVYPNPASDNVTIESTGDLTGATIELIDSYGMTHSVPVYVSGTTAALNTSSLQSGLYKLNVVTKNGLVFTNNLLIAK